LQYQTKNHLALLKKHLQFMDVVVVEVWEHWTPLQTTHPNIHV
jgi:hypothetical protein